MKKFNYKDWKKKNRKSINKKQREEYKRLSPKIKQISVDFYNKKDILHYPFEVKKAFAQRIAQRIKITDKSYCKKCGKKKSQVRLERHHPNYNFPLKIKVLCNRCHTKLHKRNSKKIKN